LSLSLLYFFNIKSVVVNEERQKLLQKEIAA